MTQLLPDLTFTLMEMQMSASSPFRRDSAHFFGDGHAAQSREAKQTKSPRPQRAPALSARAEMSHSSKELILNLTFFRFRFHFHETQMRFGMKDGCRFHRKLHLVGNSRDPLNSKDCRETRNVSLLWSIISYQRPLTLPLRAHTSPSGRMYVHTSVPMCFSQRCRWSKVSPQNLWLHRNHLEFHLQTDQHSSTKPQSARVILHFSFHRMFVGAIKSSATHARQLYRRK